MPIIATVYLFAFLFHGVCSAGDENYNENPISENATVNFKGLTGDAYTVHRRNLQHENEKFGFLSEFVDAFQRWNVLAESPKEYITLPASEEIVKKFAELLEQGLLQENATKFFEEIYANTNPTEVVHMLRYVGLDFVPITITLQEAIFRPWRNLIEEELKEILTRKFLYSSSSTIWELLQEVSYIGQEDGMYVPDQIWAPRLLRPDLILKHKHDDTIVDKNTKLEDLKPGAYVWNLRVDELRYKPGSNFSDLRQDRGRRPGEKEINAYTDFRGQITKGQW